MFDERRFKTCVALKGLTMIQVSEMLHIDAATLHRKIRRTGDFSRSEIENLCDFLEIDDPRPVFFAKKRSLRVTAGYASKICLPDT